MASVTVAFWVVAMLVLLALAFDFMNGFHDAANSIATVVSTGVLRPHTAVAFAAFFNVVAIFVFHRERLQIEPRLTDDNIPFEPDVIQFDYSLHPALWVECGECSVSKLHKLAVKIPDSEIWVVKRSLAEAESLYRSMEKEELRRSRYGLIGLDHEMFDELCALAEPRKQFTWFGGSFDPATMQFEFNGLWFDSTFHVLKF